jgi:hypothetical protein
LAGSSAVVARDKNERFPYTHAALNGLRRHSTPAPRASAHELHVPKSVELEKRISRLEIKLQHALEDLEQTRQRITALQARLDHYTARFGQI